MPRIIIHIDRLVLTGFLPEDRHSIAAGLEQELARVFATPGAASPLQQMADIPRMNLGGVEIAHGANPGQVGTTVAQRIGRGIGK